MPTRAHLRIRIGVLAGLWLVFAAVPESRAENVLASSMVDRSIYRDGEVRASQATFGEWVLMCDEIVRLQRRFCSLRTAVLQGSAVRLLLDVSTGDNGKPAALLHIPTGVSVADGVKLSPTQAKRAGRTKPTRIRLIPIALCNAGECEGVLTLSPDEIAALNSGTGLQVSYEAVDPRAISGLASRLGRGSVRTVQIPGRGFHEAVEASLH